MPWEQEIAKELQDVQIAVRFDIEQILTDAEKNTARNNIDLKSTATNISDDDYSIVLNY